MTKIEHFIFNAFQTRCSVVWEESGKCVFVDPGCSTEQEIAEIVSFVQAKGLTPEGIMLTWYGRYEYDKRQREYF